MKVSVLLLAAGYGSRLRPFTDIWPKCLMPINGIPLLEIWLDSVLAIEGVSQVFVNMHYKEDIVSEFLRRPKYTQAVIQVFERELLGTAGTVRRVGDVLGDDESLLVIHADNFCEANLEQFLWFHHSRRPREAVATMMLFDSDTPETCGTVVVNEAGILQEYYEKTQVPKTSISNAAIYVFSPEVVRFIVLNKNISDISTEVVPKLIGQIATWMADGLVLDIGSLASLSRANSEAAIDSDAYASTDEWAKVFAEHPIHNLLEPEFRRLSLKRFL